MILISKRSRSNRCLAARGQEFGGKPLAVRDMITLEGDGVFYGNIIRILEKRVIIRNPVGEHVVFIPKDRIRRVDRNIAEYGV